MRLGTACFGLLAVVALSAAVAPRSEAGITVDGDLSDWGITLETDSLGSVHFVYDEAYGYAYTGDTWFRTIGQSGTATLSGGPTVYYHLEDSDDYRLDYYQVGPLYGGQNYDAEALLVTIVDDTLYIAIASGQRPDNQDRWGNIDAMFYAPGDVRIWTDAADSLYGVEVGGGAGGQIPPLSPEEIGADAAGWTYQLDSSGYTQSSAARADATAGSLWHTTESDDWLLGENNVRTQLVGGDEVVGAAVQYVFNYATSLGEHSIIEIAIPYYDTIFNGCVEAIRWSPACANDLLCLSVDLPIPVHVPEPGSFLIWTLLVLGCVGWRWRCKRWRGRSTS